MRKALLFTSLLLVVIISGCSFFQVPVDPIEPNTKPMVALLSPLGKINPMIFSNGNDWYAVPLELKTAYMATYFDQYGSPAGLSDDSVWSISDVKIKIDAKEDYDTVFTPMGEYVEGYSVYGVKNAFSWYPYWTGGIEGYTQLPYAPFPGVGRYPYKCNTSVTPPPFAGGWASIFVEAVASRVTVEIIVPEVEGAIYKLELPGYTWQSSNRFSINLTEPGFVNISWKTGSSDGVYGNIMIPADWFYISKEFRIQVMGSPGCANTCNSYKEVDTSNSFNAILGERI